MRVTVDRQLCQGTGFCQRLLPRVFQVEAGKSTVVDERPGEEFRVALEEAEDLCPTGAVRVEP